VVTAVTATTSIAPDIESTWKGLLAGESGIRVLEDEFVTKWDLPVRIGGHLVESIDGLNFQGGDNVFPVHITLNPRQRIGFVNGPELTTAIQSFSY